MKEKKIGNLYGFSSVNYAVNVYEKNNLRPTINTCQGGGKHPMIVEKANVIKMVRTEEGKKLRKQYENHEIHHGFNEFREPELRKDVVCNTLTYVQKDNMICVAMRGRNPDNPSDRTPGIRTEQRLEINQNGTINTLTSVQKDNLIMGTMKIKQATKDGIYAQYKIRKLTPRECWRLMGFSDSDFEKAQEVNSNTQLYKQAGNSIVRSVLMAIFSQLNIQCIKSWNDRTVEERKDMLKERDKD